MKLYFIASAAAIALSSCSSGSAEIDPIPGSITDGGHIYHASPSPLLVAFCRMSLQIISVDENGKFLEVVHQTRLKSFWFDIGRWDEEQEPLARVSIAGDARRYRHAAMLFPSK
jgi:hypothetical protein